MDIMVSHGLVITNALTPAWPTMGAAMATVNKSWADSKPNTFLHIQQVESRGKPHTASFRTVISFTK